MLRTQKAFRLEDFASLVGDKASKALWFEKLFIDFKKNIERYKQEFTALAVVKRLKPSIRFDSIPPLPEALLKVSCGRTTSFWVVKLDRQRYKAKLVRLWSKDNHL